MQSSFTEDGRLQVEMPFHLSPKRRPSSCDITSATPDTHCLVPIYRDAGTGRRHITLDFRLGPDFAADDVAVDVTGTTISIIAAYGAEIGAYGAQVKTSCIVSINGMSKIYTAPFTRNSQYKVFVYFMYAYLSNCQRLLPAACCLATATTVYSTL